MPMIEIDATEFKARELLAGIMQAPADLRSPNWTMHMAIARAFLVMYSSALTVERVEQLIEAISGFKPVNTKARLNHLVKGRILRRRYSTDGKPLYELNY